MTYVYDSEDLQNNVFKNKRKLYKFEDAKKRTCYTFVPRSYKSNYVSVLKNDPDALQKISDLDNNSHDIRFRGEDDKRWIIKAITKKSEDTGDFEIIDTIPPGYYEIEYDQSVGEYVIIESHLPKSDKFIELGSHFEQIKSEFEQYYSSIQKYYEYNKMPKRGLLLYGDPGCGKTLAIMEAVKEYKNDKVIFLVHGEVPFGLIKHLKYYPNDYVFIFEELTQAYDNHTLGLLLTFLDGELSLEKQLVVATTNYPEDLPLNLVDRPGRFDSLIHVEMPDAAMRKKYLEEFLKKEIDDEIIQNTNGFSIAYLSELAIQSVIKGVELGELIKFVKERKKKIKGQFAGNTKKLGL